MYIIVSVFVIMLVCLMLVVLWMYNRLILLRVDKENALQDMAKDLDAIIQHLDKKQFSKTRKKREKATTLVEKIHAFNTLEDALDTLEQQDVGVYLAKTLLQRRYYNHTTRKLNALLASFPSSILGSMLGYEKEPLFALSEKEKQGETPAVKR